MYEIGKYTAGIKAGLEIAREISLKFAEEAYPEDVFPPGRQSTSCKAAQMARITCKNVAIQINSRLLDYHVDPKP